MPKPTPRTRMPKGPARAPKDIGLDGQNCLRCDRPATVWQLAYYCATHKPPDTGIRSTNCAHIDDPVILHGVAVCGWCQRVVKHDV